MKLGKGYYYNFGSYESLEFDYSDLGLTLISGDTGAGKSTVMDAVAWCLYGQTSKDGAVDEVKRWGSERGTSGVQTVGTPSGDITICRTRGNGENDLYYKEQGDKNELRGKDIVDTQRLLEKRLGVTAELYFTAAYFHQFSRADSFFTSKAKDRRETLEKISDLTLAIRIANCCSVARKAAKVDLDARTREYDTATGRLSTYEESTKGEIQRCKDWKKLQEERKAQINKEIGRFEMGKARGLSDISKRIERATENLGETTPKRSSEEISRSIQEEQKILNYLEGSLIHRFESLKDLTELPPRCPKCLGPSDNVLRRQTIHTLHGDIEATANNISALKVSLFVLGEEMRIRDTWDKRELLLVEYQVLDESISPHIMSLQELETRKNPYSESIIQLESRALQTAADKVAAQYNMGVYEKKISALTHLYDLSNDLRGHLLQTAVSQIQDMTNRYLQDYFDGEIKVDFTLDGDKLNVDLQKNGYDCSFRQLSGGQRCLLKLCFGVSLMKAAANQAGVHFDTLFFDEALHALSDTMKVQAFRLFQELETEHSSIIMIDHAEAFKALFSNVFKVTITNDISEICGE